MAHKLFTIERLSGEDKNQDSRITKKPKRYFGTFNRLGGLTPRRSPVLANASNVRHIGQDWTGLSIVYDRSTDEFIASYYPGSPLGGPFNYSNSTTPRMNYFYAPGGGVFSFYPNVGLYTDPVINSVIFLGTDFNIWKFDDGVEYDFSVSATPVNRTGGDFDGHDVLVMSIMFVRTAHGWLPIGIKWDDAQVNGGNNAIEIQVTVNNALTGFNYVIKTYIAYRNTSTGIAVEWSHFDDFAFPGFTTGTIYERKYAEQRADYPKTSKPHIIGKYVLNVANGDRYPSEYTYSHSRAFYTHATRDNVRKFKVDWITAPTPRLMATYADAPFNQANRQYVVFTDTEHLAFSDILKAPPHLMFDDRIDAVEPSVRGIYAFSEMSMWEAYGDFATLPGTRVDLVPMTGGVDDTPYMQANTTFSGDVVYAVKENRVYHLGPGGSKPVGWPEFIPENSEMRAIVYDRVKRRLIALVYKPSDSAYDILEYDPNANQWSLIDTMSTVDTNGTGIVSIVEGDKLYITENYEVLNSGALRIYVEYEDIDMGAPGIRKRIHRLFIPTINNNTIGQVSIRPHGSTTWTNGTLNWKNGSLEVRFPSVVSEAFDLIIDTQPATLSENDALNPPIIIVFEPREKLYAQD